jgi:GT2 family glycosyltransferase
MNVSQRAGAVVIGRNEGDRLVRSLASVTAVLDRVVYVDSGSSDDSVAAARAAGVAVVELDPSTPFSAARARNEGFDALELDGSLPDYVQFIDGDCELVPSWIGHGVEALDADPELGLVTGWRSEIDRDRSVYNQMCDYEWHRPAGEIRACGGDMLVRSDAFRRLGGFDPTCIAAEDGEFCFRLRKDGWKLLRLPRDMTRHDAAMTRFGEWWRRAVRNGHGVAHVGTLHADFFPEERRRTWFYGAVLPIATLISLFFTSLGLVLAAAIYAASYVRTARGLQRNGLPKGEAITHAAFFTLGKVPNLIGMLTYWRRRMKGEKLRLIEYK